jgi:predicted amidohydrolase YtcJ
MADSKKEQLVRFLEQRAFRPVLNAKPSGRSEADRKRLEHVQRATKAEVARFHKYGSAEEVVTNFHRDLDSAPAKRIHAARPTDNP